MTAGSAYFSAVRLASWMKEMSSSGAMYLPSMLTTASPMIAHVCGVMPVGCECPEWWSVDLEFDPESCGFAGHDGVAPVFRGVGFSDAGRRLVGPAGFEPATDGL